MTGNIVLVITRSAPPISISVGQYTCCVSTVHVMLVLYTCDVSTVHMMLVQHVMLVQYTCDVR